jgi:hypothetical protein
MARAEKLVRYGLKTYETINAPKYDLRLFFASDNLQALEAALAPEERADFAVVWRAPAPKPAPEIEAAPGAAAAAGRGALLGCFGGARRARVAAATASPCGTPTGSSGGGAHAVVAEAAVVLPAAKSAAGLRDLEVRHAAAEARAGGWVLYHCNYLAYMYRDFYHREVSREAKVPQRALRMVEPFLAEEQRAAGGVLRHMFTPVAK